MEIVLYGILLACPALLAGGWVANGVRARRRARRFAELSASAQDGG